MAGDLDALGAAAARPGRRPRTKGRHEDRAGERGVRERDGRIVRRETYRNQLGMLDPLGVA